MKKITLLLTLALLAASLNSCAPIVKGAILLPIYTVKVVGGIAAEALGN